MMLIDTYLDSYNVVPWCFDVQWGITQATRTQNFMGIGRIVIVCYIEMVNCEVATNKNNDIPFEDISLHIS